MSEPGRIAEQMRRVHCGGAWHGPSVAEALEGLSARAAAAHPIRGAHSIWEIVLHLEYTQQVLFRRLGGEPAFPSEEEFWPPVKEDSEAAWQAVDPASRGLTGPC